MDQKIEVAYDEKITLEKVKEILVQAFPEYKMSQQNWGMNAPFVRLKKSIFVHAIVFVKQKPKKNITRIGINGGMAPIAVALFGYVLHGILRGDFLVRVEEAIRKGLLYN